jgi:hypothetical protein
MLAVQARFLSYRSKLAAFVLGLLEKEIKKKERRAGADGLHQFSAHNTLHD